MIQDTLAAYLLNAAWQAPVVAVCAFIVTRFGGLSAQARNRVWLGFLGLAVILPGVALDVLLPHAAPTVARVTPTLTEAFVAPPAEPGVAALASAPPALLLTPGSAWIMDAMAAQAMGSSKAYARRLISLAQTLGAQTLGAQTLGGHPTQAALAVGLFGRSDLEDRLMQLMKPADAETPLVRAARLTGLAAL